MAVQGPVPLDRGGIPSRFKSIVRDIKGLAKDFRRPRQAGRNKEVISSNEQLPYEELIPTTEDVYPSDTRSLFRDNPHVRSLSIRVTVGFGEPLNYSSSQDYEASSSLQPTEELCEALLRRVDHCSQELITRKDSSALERTDTDGKAKPLRYEIQVQVLRNKFGAGTEIWASRTLRSYQRQPLGTAAAREVILSTHYMVGLFLRRHDEAFVWKDSPVREDPLQEQKAFQYEPGRVQPLTTIPRSYFLEKQQCFESIPGYTVHCSIVSQNRHRTPPQWCETVEVNSHQSSPLTLSSAESLFLDACYAVDGVFNKERKAFELSQAPCAHHSGCKNCRSHEDDGVEIVISVNNNIGPLFDNLERTMRTSINMFRKDHATDCTEFAKSARAAIEQVCYGKDGSISQMNDFEFYITELRGQGWTIDEPLAFTLGPETCFDRRTIEALLDRLQTGVAEILQGSAIAVKMTARKRGHSILHKTLVAREPFEKPGSKQKSLMKSKAYVLDRLKQRIERDIEMVCKDTCSIVNREVETVKANSVTSTPSPQYGLMDAGNGSSGRLSDLTIPSNGPVQNERGSSVDKADSKRSGNLDTRESGRRQITGEAGETRDLITGLQWYPLLQHDLALSEPNEKTSRESAAPNNKSTRDIPTERSPDPSTSHEKSKTSPQTPPQTADSTTPPRPQEAAKSSLRNSHGHDEEWYTTEESGSTRPQTPSLESGGSSSARSSPVISEKTHELMSTNGVKIVQNSTPDVESGDSGGTENVDNYLKKLLIRQSSSPLPQSFSQVSSVPSTISEARFGRKQRPFRSSGSEDISSRETRGSSQSESENAGKTSDLDDNKAIKDTFSQSKPDFEFSIATSETDDEVSDDSSSFMEESNSGNLDPQTDDLESPSPGDPSSENDDDDDETHLTLTIPAQRLNLKSLGSANYLNGFHEQGFYSVGLRRPVLGSSTPPRPFTPVSARDTEASETKEPETAGTPRS
ncbi:hypothetical protein GGS21DRAFT_74568 [Xylaria nigripes]|nr:hypothetical protein GGS21DRAFT_74568 [Xylaria nigripes]